MKYLIVLIILSLSVGVKGQIIFTTLGNYKEIIRIDSKGDTVIDTRIIRDTIPVIITVCDTAHSEPIWLYNKGVKNESVEYKTATIKAYSVTVKEWRNQHEKNMGDGSVVIYDADYYTTDHYYIDAKKNSLPKSWVVLNTVKL